MRLRPSSCDVGGVHTLIRLAIILSALIVIGVWLARWWFWSRAQASGRRMQCSMSVHELQEQLGVKLQGEGSERDAASLGQALRMAGMVLLEKDGHAIARKRRYGWWNLKVLPVLLIVILIFSFFNRSFSSAWVVGIGCVVIAMHVILRIAGMSVELLAVKRGWEELQKHDGLHRMDEAEAVLHCARASAWNSVLPW